jgi:hypothetical protein
MAQPGNEPLLFLDVEEADRREFLRDQPADEPVPRRVVEEQRRVVEEPRRVAEEPHQSDSVRLPDFWVSDPNMWFARAEAVFRRARINSSIVRYDYVLMKLPEDVLRSVRDLVQAVTDETADAYEQLKYRLLSSYGMSKWQLAGRIIDFTVSADARPSTLLDGMLSLLPTGEQPGVIFMALFLKKLPQDVRDHLCSRNFESVRDMAIFADQMWDARGSLSYPMVAAIGSRSPNRGRRRSRSGGQASSSRRRPTPAARDSELCYYHANYADRAHKCRAPCSWTGNALAAGTN